MATITEQPARAATVAPTTPPLDPELLHAKTGLTIDEWNEILDTLSLEELESLEGILTGVERHLLTRNPGVRDVLGRAEGVLRRVEDLARRSGDAL